MRHLFLLFLLGLIPVVGQGAPAALPKALPGRFELRPYTMQIPEWPDDVAGYELLTRSNRFEIFPPPDFITRYDAASRSMSMVSPDGRTSIRFQLTTNFTSMPVASAALDAVVTNRLPADLTLTHATRVVNGRRVPSVVAEWGDELRGQRLEHVWCADSRFCAEFRVEMFAIDVHSQRNLISGFFGSFVRTDPPRELPRAPAQ